MNEADFKADMMKWFRKHPGKPWALRHEDKLTSGVPDISVTKFGRTLWVEAKIRTKNGITERDIQSLSLRHLEEDGLALYAIYDRVLDRIEIVRPSCRESEQYWVIPGYNPKVAVHLMMRYIAKWPSCQIATSTVVSTPPSE